MSAVSTFAKIGCQIINMPLWAKILIGTSGAAVALASGVGAGAVIATVLSSSAAGAAGNALFYTLYSLYTGRWDGREYLDALTSGAADGYMFAGADLGLRGFKNLGKSGKTGQFLLDETGSISYKGGKETKTLYHYTNEEGW